MSDQEVGYKVVDPEILKPKINELEIKKLEEQKKELEIKKLEEQKKELEKAKPQKFVDNSPTHWYIIAEDEGIFARNDHSGETFKGSIKEFNEAMRK
jgi:hypothetical protein